MMALTIQLLIDFVECDKRIVFDYVLEIVHVEENEYCLVTVMSVQMRHLRKTISSVTFSFFLVNLYEKILRFGTKAYLPDYKTQPIPVHFGDCSQNSFDDADVHSHLSFDPLKYFEEYVSLLMSLSEVNWEDCVVMENLIIEITLISSKRHPKFMMSSLKYP